MYKAHCKLVEQNNLKQNLLACLRRNGFLAYRPDWEKNCLSKVEGQLAEKYKQGNHRMPSTWIEQRYNWLNDKGVPVEADWSNGCGPGVKAVEDMEDPTQHGDYGSKVKLACFGAKISEPHVELTGDVDVSEELPNELPPSVEIKSAAENRRKEAIDEYLSTQKKGVESQQKKDNRAKIKLAYKELLPKWRAEMRSLEVSRKQLLEALVPIAGESNKRQRLFEEAAATSKVFRTVQEKTRVTQRLWNYLLC